MADDTIETIFQGREYTVECTTVDPRHPYLIMFQAFSEKDASDKPAGWRSHMRHLTVDNNYNFIMILPHASDWYQRPEMAEVIAAILAKTGESRRIGYGQSMGGYGALNYYYELKLSSVIVAAPSASCYRSVVAWDRRLPGKEKQLRSRGIEPMRDWVLTLPPIPHGYILYDPYNLDGRHARMILARHPRLTPLPMRFCGHSPVGLLKELGIEEKWLLNLMRDTGFSRDEFYREIREGSPGVPEFQFILALRLSEHRWFKSALQAVEHAVALRKDFSPALKLKAELLCRTGKYAAALEILEPMAAHPKHAGRALHVIARFALEVPDNALRARYLELAHSLPEGDIAVARARDAAATRQPEWLTKGSSLFGELLARVFGKEGEERKKLLF